MEHIKVKLWKPGWVRLIPEAGYALLSKRIGSIVSEAYVKIESINQFAAIPK